jgi:hypothetical protein
MDQIGTSPLVRTFSKGKMNKAFDERVLPDGEYIDALNVRTGSTELSSLGALENSLGNTLVDDIIYNGATLTGAKCLGAFADSSNERIYWFVTKPGVVDMILSHDMKTSTTTYHVVSTSILNFDESYLINGINLINGLLFWTDGLNPPRKIQVNRYYPQPIAGVDQITEEDVNVIVKPPIYSPSIVMTNIAGEENYIDDRMVSFAYRYQYEDGEYSAMSPFSDIAFEPGSFQLDYATYNNEGMENLFNAVEVSFNTGGKNVTGVDLCFKLSDGNVINVIEKYEKALNGWLDNSTQTVVFSNKKIYTTLTQGELLRLYDNVPLKAKAQTVMGNRIMYGNYTDGYDIASEDGIPINMDFSSELISVDIEPNEQTSSVSNGDSYTIDAGSSVSIDGSRIDIELDPTLLKKNNNLIIEFAITHDSFGGDPSYAGAPENQFIYTFVFNMTRDYVSVDDLITSPEFVSSVSSSVTPITDCSSGISLTDEFNCNLVAKPASGSIPAWTKEGTGISGINQGFAITPDAINLNKFYIQCIAAKYKLEDPVGVFTYAYEYFTNSFVTVSIEIPGSNRSLHSNRDYEAGIVYLDEYGRSSTVLACPQNTIFCPPSAADKKNNIRLTINNVAPYWAKYYRVFMKQSKSGYDTIFSDIYYTDEDGFTWFKVSGENASKISISSDLIVKKDSIGPLDRLVKTKPLEVVFKTEDFIADNGVVEPAGTYMKIFASNFSAITKPNSNVEIKTGRTGSLTQIALPLHEDNPLYNSSNPITTGNEPFRPIPIPAGSLVHIKFSLRRNGRGTNCESYNYNYDKRFTAARDYSSFLEMVIFQNIDFTDGTYSGGEDQNTGTQDNTLSPFGCYMPSIGDTCGFYIAPLQGIDQWDFKEGYVDDDTLEPKDGRMYLVVASGTKSCSGVWNNTRTLTNEASIVINQPSDIVIFETESDDAPEDFYYESFDTYDIIDGYHQGDIQDQDISNPAILDLGFFNCFSFGNGCESYKYNDSIVGHSFNLGERVSSVSEEEYKQVYRYGSVTYSGIYNSFTNVNKLNEFNLGLVNYKDLEYSFGPIQTLFGRKNDMLVLQEDKISYVLVEKDLLSDAGAGQALTAVPFVLGQQIPRLENYGISMNPESFVSYGQKMYFTDVKRMAVISLEGSSYNSDSLGVLSDSGLKYWFRDEFKNSVNKFKVGGYDPYMSEYVLSLKDETMPYEDPAYDCGFFISQYQSNTPILFRLNLGNSVGLTELIFNFTEGGAVVSVEYDGVVVVDDARVSGESATVSFEKSNPMVGFASVSITPDDATYTVSSICPENENLTVHKIVINGSGYVDQTIHAQFRWKYNSYLSPIDTDYVTFDDDGVSLEKDITGEQSQGVIPVNGSDVYLISNKFSGDTYDFNPSTNRFRYLATNTTYSIPALLPLTSEASPIVNPSTGRYYGVANDVDLTTNQHLYLVWDYRTSSSIELCYAVNSLETVCCNCDSTSTYYIDADSFEFASAIYTDSGLTIPAPDGYYSLGVATAYRRVLDGVLQPLDYCDDCDPCTTWTGGTFIGDGGIEVEFSYLDCDFVEQTFNFTLPVNPDPTSSAEYTLDPFRCAIVDSAYMTPITGVSDVTFTFDSEVPCGGTVTCQTWDVTGDGGAGGAEYIDCYGNNQSVSVLDGETIEFCASNIPTTTGFGSIGLVSTSCTIP